MKIVVCPRDRWQHFAVTREYAEAQIKQFNDWYDQQPPETQRLYSGKSSLRNYACHVCGGTEFRPFDASIDPELYGSTISPVIYESD